MNIVVDAMGGDDAPEAVVAGAVDAIKEFDVQITFVGIQDKVQKELDKYEFPQDKVSIVHAPEVVGMHEPATITLRRKKNSSISVGVRLLKESKGDAFISAGNTGAVVAASTIILRMLEGVERPAIGTVMPTLNKFSLMLDAGANTDAKSRHLLQSALMSRVYARDVLGIENPRVGLVNIGSEAGKGTDFAKETHKLLSDNVDNFIGNIEANEIFKGECECVICDGFVGNIVLKVSEGLAESMGKLIKREIKKDPIAMLGAIMMKWRLREVKRLIDYAEYGGAPLLGVNGIVMICHGRSSPKAIKNAIKAAKREVEHKILTAMKQEVSKAGVEVNG